MIGAVLAAAAITSTIGDFVYVEAKDPMTDRAIYAAVVQADEAELSIMCNQNRSNTVFVRLDTERALNIPASAILAKFMSFEYRVDEQKPILEFVEYGHRDLTFDGPQARAFAERIAKGTNVVVRVEGLSQYIIPSFRLSGAKEAITKLAQQCRDKRLIGRLETDQRGVVQK